MQETLGFEIAVGRTSQSSRVAALATFEGSTEAFWSAYLAAVATGATARRVVLAIAGGTGAWQAVTQHPQAAEDHLGDADLMIQLLGQFDASRPTLAQSEQECRALVIGLPGAPVGKQQRAAMVLFFDGLELSGRSENLLMDWLTLVASVPAQYANRRQSLGQPVSSERAGRLFEMFELVIGIGRESRFMKMAFALCNELVVRYDCDRVSLGWVKGPYVRLKATSHVEKFDPRSTAVRSLESVMEEAMEQQSLIFYPPAGQQTGLILRAHETFAEGVGGAYLLTVPIVRGENVEGVICLERNSAALTEADRWEIRLIGEAISRALAELHDRDLWWVDRLKTAGKGWMQGLMGPRNAAWKLAGGAAFAFLLVAMVLPWSYRVDSALAIRSKDLLFMPAPFDGYLRRVHVQVGDRVAQGDILVELDTSDLSLEESMASAEVQRSASETQKAQGMRQLAEMQINYARQLQSAARLDLIRNQLNNAQIRAPYEGIVIEGDLKKNVGAPVRKGDLLLKFAKTEDAFIELEIDQAYVHEVRVGSKGEFALVGRPDQKFKFTVDRVDPVAVSREGRSVYLARASADGGFQPVWRPGMGGTAKIDAGDRSLLWVMTHRTVRFLREFFWI